MISARCVACDLHTVAPGPLEQHKMYSRTDVKIIRGEWGVGGEGGAHCCSGSGVRREDVVTSIGVNV